GLGELLDIGVAMVQVFLHRCCVSPVAMLGRQHLVAHEGPSARVGNPRQRIAMAAPSMRWLPGLPRTVKNSPTSSFGAMAPRLSASSYCSTWRSRWTGRNTDVQS